MLEEKKQLLIKSIKIILIKEEKKWIKIKYDD